MSEKRFIIIKSIENYHAIVDKERDDIGEIILLSLHKEEQLYDLVDLLNELNEENQELKRLIKKMGELGGFNKHLIKTICEDLK